MVQLCESQWWCYYGLGGKETWLWKYPKVLPIQALHNLIWESVVLRKLSLLDHHRLGAHQLVVYSSSTLCRLLSASLFISAWTGLLFGCQVTLQYDLSSLKTNF